MNERVVNFQYWYKAKVVSVYDADTIRVNVDLGLGITNCGGNGKGVSVRLYGIDAPEVRGDEREQGIIARDRLRELILDKEVIIQTIKDKTGKYGRYLVMVYTMEYLCVNEWLIEENLAEKRYY
jgi:micrococcal nuclease